MDKKKIEQFQKERSQLIKEWAERTEARIKEYQAKTKVKKRASS